MQEVCLPLYILSDIESFQSYIPPTDVINFVCQTVNESYVEGSRMRMQLLPSFWQMGIDLEGKSGSCCLWEFYFHLFPRPQRTKGQVKALSGPARANALTEVPIQSGKKAYTHVAHRGLERFSGLLKVIQLVESTPMEFSSPVGQAASVGLGNQRGHLCMTSTTHCVLQVNLTFGAAIPSPLKEIDGLPLHMLVCFLTRLRTKLADEGRVPSSYSSSSPFSAPQPWAVLTLALGS